MSKASAVTADVKLEYPVSVDGAEYGKLTMRRPKVSDNQWAADQKCSDMNRGIKLLARLCDVPPEVISELDEFDATKLQEQLDSFRGGSGAS